MAARIALVLVSLLVLAWTAVLLRDEEVGRAAQSELSKRARQVPRAEFARSMHRLEDAELLNPARKWQLYRSYFWFVRGRPQLAARLAREVIRSERDNIFAWSQLYLAERASGQPGWGRAAARVRQLNPLASGSPR